MLKHMCVGVLFWSALAFAQTAGPGTSPSPNLSPSSLRSTPNFCVDLDFLCIPPRGGDISNLITRLSQTDPHRFMPDELADFVLECERERRTHGGHNPMCRTRSPFAGLFDHIMFIPASHVQSAGLPATGARLVHDCARELHVQMRADLPFDRQMQLIRRVLSDLVRYNLRSFIRVLPQAAGGIHSALVTADVCELGAGRQPPRRPMTIQEWMRSDRPRFSLGGQWSAVGGTFEGEANAISEIPRSYVTASCFDGAHLSLQSSRSGLRPIPADGGYPLPVQPVVPFSNSIGNSVAGGGAPTTNSIQIGPPTVSVLPDAATLQNLRTLKDDANAICGENSTSAACRDAERTLRDAVAQAFPNDPDPDLGDPNVRNTDLDSSSGNSSNGIKHPDGNLMTPDGHVIAPPPGPKYPNQDSHDMGNGQGPGQSSSPRVRRGKPPRD